MNAREGIFDIEKQKIHGGTLRYYIGRKNTRQITQNVSNYLELEEKNKPKVII